jgi:hypothetical protein
MGGHRVALADVRLDGVQQLAAELDGSGATAVAIELGAARRIFSGPVTCSPSVGAAPIFW